MGKTSKNSFIISQQEDARDQFSNFIRTIQRLNKDGALSEAFKTGPQALIENRNYLQVVLDDTINGFIDIMSDAVKNSELDLDDAIHIVPIEFYAMLMTARDKPQYSKTKPKEFRALLKEAIEDRNLNGDVILHETPPFIRIAQDVLQPIVFGTVINQWIGMMDSFASILMREEALAAKDAVRSYAESIQGLIDDRLDGDHLNELLSAVQSGNLNGATGAKGKDEKEPSYKIHSPEDIGDLKEELDGLVGMEKPKELFAKLQASKKHTAFLKAEFNATDKAFDGFQHYVFRGNPGTGKTTFARLIGKMEKEVGNLKKGHVVEVDAGDLIAGYLGQTNGKTEEAINAALDGVLFIDEAYLLNDDAGSGKGFGKDAIGKLVKDMEMHKDRLTIIFAGYPENMDQLIKTNPGLSRRTKYIDFDDYSIDQLMAIFDMNIEKMKLKITPEAKTLVAENISVLKRREQKHFGNAGTVKNYLNALHEQLALQTDGESLFDQFNAASGADKDALREKLVTITPEIVKSLKFSKPGKSSKRVLGLPG